MICLTHIPKTGGTTFRYILINNYSWMHIDVPETKTLITCNDFRLFRRKIFNKIKSISGHTLRYSVELERQIPGIKFVVFVRDPISRIISNYHHYCREHKPISFESWVMHDYYRPMFHNYQTRFICGSSDIENAKNILQSHYFFVGTIDLYDQSLLYFKRMMGNNIDIRYEKMRSSKKPKQLILEDPTNKMVIERLRQDNRADIELNRFVKNELLKRWSEKYGKITSQDIENFRNSNKDFSFKRCNTLIFKMVKYIYYQNVLR